MSHIASTLRAQTLRAVALVFVVFATAACMNGEQQTAFDLVNQTRSQHGRTILLEDASASDKAQAWAEHLAAKGSLSHSNLPSGIDAGWKALGENVGYGGSIQAVHQGYMNSPGHRSNILDAGFTHMGVGVAKKGNLVFTVQVFVRR